MLRWRWRPRAAWRKANWTIGGGDEGARANPAGGEGMGAPGRVGYRAAAPPPHTSNLLLVTPFTSLLIGPAGAARAGRCGVRSAERSGPGQAREFRDREAEAAAAEGRGRGRRAGRGDLSAPTGPPPPPPAATAAATTARR